jgi:hypothetical protein
MKEVLSCLATWFEERKDIRYGAHGTKRKRDEPRWFIDYDSNDNSNDELTSRTHKRAKQSTAVLSLPAEAKVPDPEGLPNKSIVVTLRMSSDFLKVIETRPPVPQEQYTFGEASEDNELPSPEAVAPPDVSDDDSSSGYSSPIQPFRRLCQKDNSLVSPLLEAMRTLTMPRATHPS